MNLLNPFTNVWALTGYVAAVFAILAYDFMMRVDKAKQLNFDLNNPQLDEWIVKCKQMGFSDYRIRREMKKTGWHKDVIEYFINKHNN